VAKLENKRPLPNCRCGWKDNINTDLKYAGWEDVHWIVLAQIRDKLRVHIKRAMKFWFHKTQGNSWLPDDVPASQEEL
jgi:hypothetical protein